MTFGKTEAHSICTEFLKAGYEGLCTPKLIEGTRSALSAMCELEHDAAKDRFEIHQDCSFERPLPRRRLHRSMNIAATADKCCVSISCTCTSPVCPHSGPLCKAQRRSGFRP
jgi:hypothetical protein